MFNILDYKKSKGQYRPPCSKPNCQDSTCVDTEGGSTLLPVSTESSGSLPQPTLPDTKRQDYYVSETVDDASLPSRDENATQSLSQPEHIPPLASVVHSDGDRHDGLRKSLEIKRPNFQRRLLAEADPAQLTTPALGGAQKNASSRSDSGLLLVALSVVAYILSVILLLQFLSCIQLPVWATVSLVSIGLIAYAGHTALRDFSSAWSPVYVQNTMLETTRLKMRLLPFKAWSLTNWFYQVLLRMRIAYGQFRHAVVATSAVIDHLCQLGFLTLHGAFEGAVPANGALLGLQNPFFALFSCLVAGGVEIAGEHNPLFVSDQSCCASSTSFRFGVGDYLVLFPVFLGNLLFSAVVFLECMPALLACLPSFPWWLSQSCVTTMLTAGLSLSYATVFTLILATLPAKLSSLTWTPGNVVLGVLAFVSASIWFFEFYAHIALLSPLPLAMILATATALSRALLFFLSITVTHMCGGSLDLGRFNWMKSLAAWSGGIIAGYEFFEFLGSFSVPISSPILFVLMALAVYSAVVVEGAFFGADSKAVTADSVSHPAGAVFTAVSSLLLPQRVTWSSVLLSGIAAIAVSMQGASVAFGLLVGISLLGTAQRFLEGMTKSTSRAGLQLSRGVGYANGSVSSALLNNKSRDDTTSSSVEQSKLSFLSYLEHLSGNACQAR